MTSSNAHVGPRNRAKLPTSSRHGRPPSRTEARRAAGLVAKFWTLALASVQAVLIAAILVASLASGPAHAEARHAALVMDANTGRILVNQAADEPRFPASLTKMMTLYMAFELIEAGRLSYGSRIKISQEAASAAPSKLDLEPGEEITVIDAIRALVTKSANDIAVAMAEHIGGTEENFARLMTAKARQIGMRATTFRNASGLPDPQQVTTARDMVTLALRLQDDFPRHYPLFSTRQFVFQGNAYRNHNTLLGTYPGIDGIKTGYTRASGFNLVSSVRRDGRHVVAAVFGGTTAASRNALMRALLTRGLASASIERTRVPQLVAKPRPAPRPTGPALAAAIAAAEARPLAQRNEPPRPAPSAQPRVQPQVQPGRVAPHFGAQPTASPRLVEPQQAVAPAAPAAEAATQALAALDAAQPGPTIEIARVRRVMVAPRSATRTASITGETTEEPLPGAPAVQAAPAQPAAVQPALAQQAAAQPVQVALGPFPAVAAPSPLATSASPAHQTVPTAGPVSVSGPPVQRARPPSTLQQQAAEITGVGSGEPRRLAATSYAPASVPAAYRLNGPVGSAPSVAVPAPTFQIQVGAFGSPAEAERNLATVRANTGTLLAGHTPVALPVQKGDRQLYRARFTGFDANAAARACLELRRMAVDCFVMKAE